MELILYLKLVKDIVSAKKIVSDSAAIGLDLEQMNIKANGV
jgi:hypothetical protein